MFKKPFRGFLVLFGGFLVHLTLGTGFTYGNMSPYIASYLRVHGNKDVTNEDAIWGYAMIVFGQGSLMFLGGFLTNKIGPRITSYIGCTIASAGVAVTYYTIEDSLAAMVATYGLMFGFGISLAYVPALATGMKWFPETKGLVNGIILCGFGLGAFIFTQVQTSFLNPNNISPNSEGFFEDASLLDRVPHVFLLLSGIYALCQLFGCALLDDPDRDKQEVVPLFESQSVVSSAGVEAAGSSAPDPNYGATGVSELVIALQ